MGSRAIIGCVTACETLIGSLPLKDVVGLDSLALSLAITAVSVLVLVVGTVGVAMLEPFEGGVTNRLPE